MQILDAYGHEISTKKSLLDSAHEALAGKTAAAKIETAKGSYSPKTTPTAEETRASIMDVKNPPKTSSMPTILGEDKQPSGLSKLFSNPFSGNGSKPKIETAKGSYSPKTTPTAAETNGSIVDVKNPPKTSSWATDLSDVKGPPKKAGGIEIGKGSYNPKKSPFPQDPFDSVKNGGSGELSDGVIPKTSSRATDLSHLKTGASEDVLRASDGRVVVDLSKFAADAGKGSEVASKILSGAGKVLDVAGKVGKVAGPVGMAAGFFIDADSTAADSDVKIDGKTVVKGSPAYYEAVGNALKKEYGGGWKQVYTQNSNGGTDTTFVREVKDKSGHITSQEIVNADTLKATVKPLAASGGEHGNTALFDELTTPGGTVKILTSKPEKTADLKSQHKVANYAGHTDVTKNTFKDGSVTYVKDGKVLGKEPAQNLHGVSGDSGAAHNLHSGFQPDGTSVRIDHDGKKYGPQASVTPFTSDVGSDIGKHPGQPASIVPDWHAPDEKAELAGLTTSAGSSPYVLEERAGASGATIFRMSDGTFKSYDPSRPAGDIVKSAGTWNTANWKPEISSTVSSVDGQGNVVTGASPPVVPGTVTPAPDAVDRYVSGPANQADSVPPAPSQPAVPAWHADPGWTAPSSETASLAGLSTANNGSAYVIEQRPGASGATIFRMSDGTYKSYDPSRPASDVVKSAGTWDNSTWASGQQTPIEVKPVPVAPQPSAEPAPTHDTAPAPAAPIAASSPPTPAPAAAYVDPVPQRPSVSAADSLSNLGVDSSVGHMVGRGQMRAL